MRKFHKRGRVTSSGKKKVDKLFRLIIEALNTKVWNIYKVRKIRDLARGHYQTLAGMMRMEGGDQNEIYLSTEQGIHEDKDDFATTLVHEVLHVIYPRAPEIFVAKLAPILWYGFSTEQQRIIKWYIPKRYSEMSYHD